MILFEEIRMLCCNTKKVHRAVAMDVEITPGEVVLYSLYHYHEHTWYSYWCGYG